LLNDNTTAGFTGGYKQDAPSGQVENTGISKSVFMLSAAWALSAFVVSLPSAVGNSIQHGRKSYIPFKKAAYIFLQAAE